MNPDFGTGWTQEGLDKLLAPFKGKSDHLPERLRQIEQRLSNLKEYDGGLTWKDWSVEVSPEGAVDVVHPNPGAVNPQRPLARRAHRGGAAYRPHIANFVSCAPEDMDFLLTRIQSLVLENAALRGSVGKTEAELATERGRYVYFAQRLWAAAMEAVEDADDEEFLDITEPDPPIEVEFREKKKESP